MIMSSMQTSAFSKHSPGISTIISRSGAKGNVFGSTYFVGICSWLGEYSFSGSQLLCDNNMLVMFVVVSDITPHLLGHGELQNTMRRG